MHEKTDQWLVVLDEAHAENVRAELGLYGPVTQSASPCVLLAELADSSAEALAAKDGVLAVAKGPLSLEVTKKLDLNEALWASAWAQQQPKIRSGEGLDWYAEGFEPPGPPQVQQPVEYD